jgi:hypothetical protein
MLGSGTLNVVIETDKRRRKVKLDSRQTLPLPLGGGDVPG